jgi:hypothetical protein
MTYVGEVFNFDNKKSNKHACIKTTHGKLNEILISSDSHKLQLMYENNIKRFLDMQNQNIKSKFTYATFAINILIKNMNSEIDF